MTKFIANREFVSALAQDTWAVRPDLRLTLGLQFDYGADGNPFFADRTDTLYGSHWNPRVGLTYQLNGEHLFRAAVIRSFSTHTAVRLSPTQVAGFLIDNPGPSSARLIQYHLGWDGHLSPRIFLQVQLFSKTIDVPEVSFVNGGRIVGLHRFSRTGIKANLNFTLTDTLSLSAGYVRFRRSDPTSPSVGSLASEGDEDQARAAANFIHPTGVFARAETLYTRQDLALYRTPGSPPYFFMTNLLLGYEFPRKWGLIEVGVQNLTRERFQLRPDLLFISETLLTSLRDPRTLASRPIVPDRSYFLRVVLNLGDYPKR